VCRVADELIRRVGVAQQRHSKDGRILGQASWFQLLKEDRHRLCDSDDIERAKQRDTKDGRAHQQHYDAADVAAPGRTFVLQCAHVADAGASDRLMATSVLSQRFGIHVKTNFQLRPFEFM